MIDDYDYLAGRRVLVQDRLHAVDRLLEPLGRDAHTTTVALAASTVDFDSVVFTCAFLCLSFVSSFADATSRAGQ